MHYPDDRLQMAKRISLREFQEGLVRRLTSAARGEISRAVLGVQVGPGDGSSQDPGCWLLQLADAGEILPLPVITPVPLARHWFVGVANIRGMLYGVVDFSAFLGGEPTPMNGSARLLLIGARHGSNSALLVRRTLGLKAPDGLSAFEPATAQDAASPWLAGRCRDVGAESPLSWQWLDVARLLQHPEFLDIAR